MKQEKKEVSFIIPIYNCDSYIVECVRSIESINIEQYEIVLVNDGSTDDSANICKELSNTYDSIIFVSQNNQGASAARNKGVSVARGDYVIFVDADDHIDPEKMQKVINVLRENGRIDLAIFGFSFDYYYKDEIYRKETLYYPEEGCMHQSAWLDKFYALYSVNALSPIWNKVFRRDILLQNKISFNNQMIVYEDLEFSIRYLSHCDIICNIPECVYHYRQSEDEGNAGRRLKRIETLSDVVDQIEDAIDQLIEEKKASALQTRLKSVLLDLYCVIAKEKIFVSDVREIRKICNDFACWAKKKNPIISINNQASVDNLVNRRVLVFLIQRMYIKHRHRLAVRIKSSRLYKRLRDTGVG